MLNTPIMRGGFILIVLLSLFLAVLEGPADVCGELGKAACASSHICGTQESQDQDSSHQTNHHCPIHCVHLVFISPNHLGLKVNELASKIDSSYQFAFYPIHLDGPFRPPLV